MIILPLLLCSSVSGERHYDRLYNELSLAIEKAKSKGEIEEGISKELYYESQWKRDLSPFESGITREMMGQLESLGNKYQIINHTVYRSKRCTFPARCKGVDSFLIRLSPLLEDTEFILNDFDNPKLTKQARPLPLFSFSKEDEYWDILYPAWSFHSGGPAISIYPSGIGNWSKSREELNKYSSSHPWSTRDSRAFFLGSRTNQHRDPLVLLSRRFPSLVDASFTKNQAYRSPQDTLNADPSSERPFEYNCNYKYLFNFRGVAASFRFKYLLACGSTVFHLEDGWIEFFYRKLIPYYHYIPLKERDNTQKGLKTFLEYAREHDEDMRRIGENALQWISSHLSDHSIDLYWLGLLSSYSALLKFPIERDVSLMKMDWHEFMKEEKAILLKAWAVIEPVKQQTACDIYEMIFNQCPEARKLFPRMKTAKRDKKNTEFIFQALRFMQVIESSVNAIDNLESMNNILDNLGRRHGKLEVCGKFRSYYWSVFLECTIYQFRKYLEESRKFNAETTDNAIIVWRTLLKDVMKKIKNGYTADIAHRMSQLDIRIEDRKMSLPGVSADSAFDDEN